MKKTASDDEDGDDQDVPDVKKRVHSWVCGFVNEMRKKSPATIQKWVDSIAVDEAEPPKEVETVADPLTDEPSTSGNGGDKENLTKKLGEICNKLNVNEKLRSKKQEFKSLLSKTTQKLKRESSMDHENDESIKQVCEKIEEEKEVETDNTNNLTVQRCHIGVLGRSSSENPNPKNRRLTDIGRSFSVTNENDLPTTVNSSENLIYDADEDISITIPTSPSIISNNTNQSLSNSQLLSGRSSLNVMKPLREHTVSEGHQSPSIQSKNPLLRDSSFQSDSSHCSSVDSLLEARKPDAEAILVSLGFGPAQGSDDLVSKIPKRFLKPSQVNGNDTDAFLRHQQLSSHIHENSVLGYRGLLGNSHVPSDIVKEIIKRFSANEAQRMASMESIDCKSRSFKGVANRVLLQRQFMK